MAEAIAITGRTQLVGVMGDPIGHSKSPTLLNAAFAASGLDFRMVALPVPEGRGADAVAALGVLGFHGCSVTMPHKNAVIARLDSVSDSAKRLDAVNCIRRDGTTLIGENTDGEGFIRGLAEDTGFDPAGARCVVVGAGGAARAVILALANAGATRIDVINRTRSFAEAAVALAGATGHIGEPGDVAQADLVVQATSVGMSETDPSAIDPTHLGEGQIVADLIYHPSVTPTMRAGTQAGATVSNGLSMLLHQAAVAFEHWTGVTAPIEAMRSALS